MSKKVVDALAANQDAIDALGPLHPVSKFAQSVKGLLGTVNPATKAFHTADEAVQKSMHILPKDALRGLFVEAAPNEEGGVDVVGGPSTVTRRDVREIQKEAGVPTTTASIHGKKRYKRAAAGLPTDVRGLGGAQGGEQPWSRQASLENVLVALGADFDPADMPSADYFSAPSPEDVQTASQLNKEMANVKYPEGDPRRLIRSRAKEIEYGESTGFQETNENYPEDAPLAKVMGPGTRRAHNSQIVRFTEALERIEAGDESARGDLEASRIQIGQNMANMKLTSGDVDTHVPLMTTAKSAPHLVVRGGKGRPPKPRLPGTTADFVACQTTGCMSKPYPFSLEDDLENFPIDSTLCPSCNAALTGKGDMSHVFEGETAVSKDISSRMRSAGESLVVTGDTGMGRRMVTPSTDPITGRRMVPTGSITDDTDERGRPTIPSGIAGSLVRSINAQVVPGQTPGTRRGGSGRPVSVRKAGQSLPGGAATEEEQAGASELTRRLTSGEIGNNQ